MRGGAVLGLLGLWLLGACGGGDSAGAPPATPAEQPAPPSVAVTADAGTQLVGWTRQYATAEGFVEVRELGSDRGGGLVLLAAGTTPDLGGGPLPGNTGFVLARYSAEGAPEWQRSFPFDEDFSGPSAAALAVAPGGDSFVAGVYSGAPDLGGGALPASGNGQPLFLARFAADGSHVWSRGVVAHVRVGGVRRTASVFATDLALDAEGNLLLTGSFQGAVDFGSGVLGREDTETEGHFFLAKLAPDGTALWATAFEEAVAGAALSFGLAVAADPASGHVLVSGATSPGEEVSGRAFVARFSPAGQRQWLYRFEGELPEGTLGQFVRSLAAGPDGTVYFAGSFSRRVRFAGATLESRRPYLFDSGADADLLLGAFAADGTPLWARELPGLGEGVAHEVVVEPDGGLLVRGELLSVADLGTGPLLPGPFVARYSAQGTPRAAATLDRRLQVSAQAPQPDGRLVLAAVLFWPVEVEGEVLVPQGRQDLALLQLQLAGLPAEAPTLPPEAAGAAPSVDWVRTYSVREHAFSGTMGLRALAAAPGGGFFALGRSNFGTFGGPSLVGESEFVLARYDAAGAHLWTRRFRLDARREGPVALALGVTTSGQIIVAGTYSGAPDLGGGALPRARVDGALFLARFTSTGRHVWSRGFEPRLEGGGLAALTVGGLAVGPAGDAVVTGSLRGTVDFGRGPLGSASGGPEPHVFVARFGPEGRTRWSSALPEATAGAPVSSGTAVALDAEGEVLVAATTQETEEAEVGSSFVARLDAQGRTRWVRPLQSTRLATVRSLAVDAAGTAYFGGELRGELRFAGQTVRSRGAGTLSDVLLGALDASGAERWVRELPGAAEGAVEQLALDAEGRLWARGELRSAADLGTGPLRPGPFVARYAADGTALGARSFDPHVLLRGLALQPGGGAVLGGTLDAAVDLDGERLTPQDLTDLLYLRLRP